MPSPANPSVEQSLREYARGVAGGLLFSVPLLYTMEVWWAGFLAGPERLLAGLLATLLLLLGYNRYAGLHRDVSRAEVVIDSIEELGLGLLLSALVLWLLERITPAMPVDEIAGKIVVEALVVAIGVSVGTEQLGAGSESEGASQGMSKDQKSSGKQQPASFRAQLAFAFCGAVLIAANVGPTQEIVVIGVEAALWKILMLALLSLLLGALILFSINFAGTGRHVRNETWLDVLKGSVITYAAALISAALILWFFGRFAHTALLICLSETVVLGLPAVLGASAGRLLLQP